MTYTSRQMLRGVNLGNWLLLEKWMSPGVFKDTTATDEYSLCEALGAAAERRILSHRDTYITEADFRWLQSCGINAVRIPFGYWLFDPDGPFVGSPEHLEMAIKWAEEYDIKVLLDLHGLPGSQGPNDHTGRANYFRWHTEPTYIERSLDIIEAIAQRYSGRSAIAGFSVINEPEPSIGQSKIIQFFERAYDRVRRHMPAGEVAFVLSGYPEGDLPHFHNCLPGRENVWTDVHLYQNFGDWSKWGISDYLAYPIERQGRLRTHLKDGPIIVGEWSMAIADAIRRQVETMSHTQQELLMQMHGRMMLAMLEEFRGWFFWSYKVDDMPVWSFRDSVERGWLPKRLTGSSIVRAEGLSKV